MNDMIRQPVLTISAKLPSIEPGTSILSCIVIRGDLLQLSEKKYVDAFPGIKPERRGRVGTALATGQSGWAFTRNLPGKN
jgi:hypothetical protein